MKRRRAAPKIKSPSTSPAVGKTLTRPYDKAPSNSSSSTVETKTSSSGKAPSVIPLSQGDNPYRITDIINTYHFSQLDRQLKALNERPIDLKVEEIKPDRDTIAILKSSKTLTRRQLPTLPPARGRRPLISHPDGMTLLVGKLIYRERGAEIDCSQFPAIWFPTNTDKITKMRTTDDDGALFILLVSNSEVVSNLANDLFHQRFPCIVLSAEGPPELLIRMERELKLPVLALLDCDPESLKILASYGRRLKNFKWLGIRPTDMAVDLVSPRTSSLTKQDINTVNEMLKDAYVNSRSQWIEELHIMLKNKKKVVIEALWCFCDGVASYMTEVYLPIKLQQEDWI